MAKAETSDLLERALLLEPAKRLSLAAQLVDSVEGAESETWSEAWGQEIARRLQAHADGSDPGREWSEVRARALAAIKGT